jgi:branched-subunit amino acid aminotransferase/4-amino-4-deoxychorismate lyase
LRAIETLLVQTARSTFGHGDGIVRVEWSATPGGAPELIAETRSLGADPDRWRAIVSKVVHPGPDARRNTKAVDVEAYDLARQEVREAAVDEVLLFDGEGRLVEGSRSNFILVTEGGRLATPARGLGPVEGLGLSIVLVDHPEIAEASLSREEIGRARELLSVNGVRGVVPIVVLDGHPVGDGEPGPWARRLRSPFYHG